MAGADVAHKKNKRTLLQFNNVWKTYQMGTVTVAALQGINLSINSGEFIAVTGKSGSGKSTMMNLIGCLDIPTKGTILLDGQDISHLSESNLASVRGKKIGFVFQQFHLIPTLTALQNVILPLELQDMEQDEALSKATRLLKVVGLGDRMDHLPSQLSGGQMQRVAIARALAVDPEIILADEPTGNLDSITEKFIIDFLCKLHTAEGKTIIIVTHDDDLAKRAERIVRLKDGKIERIVEKR
jgi:putative ABC transport system ATP-binding protein